VEGKDGQLYGTTSTGGTNMAGVVTGVVFKLNKDGSGYALLHSFETNGIDGQSPRAVLAQGVDATLYGTTEGGGTNRVGTIFRLNQDGSGYSVLFSLTIPPPEAPHPGNGVLAGSDGALYGASTYGGSNGWGSIFKVNNDGTGYTVLYSFRGGVPMARRVVA
jgi:uncharacterized repeat protein (TIGR03803 family)